MPLAVDLFCGLGGWTEGLLAEGYQVIGFDNELHAYGEHRYPGQLVLQDVLTLHGRQFRDADLIVASPPCQEFSYMAMPWGRARQIAVEYRNGTRDRSQLTALFDACFRIQREAMAASGRFIPLVVENVKGAQPWVGPARWHHGSYYLWGDIPALMPMTRTAFKNPGQNWSRDHSAGKVSPHWNVSAIKQHGSGAAWFDHGIASLPSSSPRRKAASALIAKIPADLAQWIGRAWHPVAL